MAQQSLQSHLWEAANTLRGSAGEREIKKVLRKTLFTYQLHADADLFGRAYGYIREYY